MAVKTWIATTPSTWGTAASWSPSGVPGSADDVIFNNTYNGDCVFAFSTIKSLVMTGYSGSFSGTANMTISGSDTGTSTGNSFVFSSTMTQSWTGAVTFTSGIGGYITLNGKSLNNNITFNNATGVWRVQDVLNQTTGSLTVTAGNVTFTDDVNVASTLTLTAGTLTALNCANITIGNQFLSSNSNVRTLNMGCGTWTFTTSNWTTATSTNMTLNAEQSRILYAQPGNANIQFQGGNLTYYTFEIARGNSTGTISIGGNNTFVNLIDNTSTAAHTIQFTTTGTNSFYKFIVQGSSGNLVTVTRGVLANYVLQKLGRDVVSNTNFTTWTAGTAMTGSAANTWYVGPNSTVGTTVGFIASNPPSVQSLLGAGGVG